MTTRSQLLLTVTGMDKPGILSEICRVLSEADALLLDIQQVTIAPLLVIALQVELAIPENKVIAEPSALVPSELLRLALRYDLQLKIQPFAGEQKDEIPESIYAVTCLCPDITPASLSVISGTLARLGVNIERITRLTDTGLKCIELTVRVPGDLDRSILKRALFTVSTEVGVDIAVQPESLFRRSKRLIVMDVDSTLIQHEVIDELAKLAGVENEVATITGQAMAGQLDFTGSLKKRVSLLAGLEASRLEEVAAHIQLTPGAEILLEVLKKLGYKTAIVSGGFTFFTERLKARLGLDYAAANTLEIENGRLTGRVTGEVIDSKAKLKYLVQIAKNEGIELAQTLAVGDGANDLLMLEAAGLGVAFNAKSIVRENADLFISQPNLDVLLYLIGMRESEIAELSS